VLLLYHRLQQLRQLAVLLVLLTPQGMHLGVAVYGWQ
jgi:hypothetical protein